MWGRLFRSHGGPQTHCYVIGASVYNKTTSVVVSNVPRPRMVAICVYDLIITICCCHEIYKTLLACMVKVCFATVTTRRGIEPGTPSMTPPPSFRNTSESPPSSPHYMYFYLQSAAIKLSSFHYPPPTHTHTHTQNMSCTCIHLIRFLHAIRSMHYNTGVFFA